jgi:LacI family transcriptional regulator
MQLMTHPEPTRLAPSAKQPENALANILREQILSGNYQTGDWLPTERALAEDLGADRRTIRMAINQLVRDGLVIRRPHCRPIVAKGGGESSEEAASKTEAASSTSSFIALLMWSGGGQLERAVTSQQRIFWGMNQALAEAGYYAVFVDMGEVGTEKENAEREAEQLRYMQKRGFGGAVFYPYAYRSNRALIEEVSRTIPLVTIDRRIDSVNADFVGVDNYQAMYDTIAHLIAQGHRRIAYITKNEQICPVQDRIQGYIDAIRDSGLDEMILSIPSRTGQAWTAIDMIFRMPKHERPTAAAVFNDYSAMDLAQRLTSMGLSVPGDVALTGFDDIVPALPSGVGMTTVAQPYEDIGVKAAEVLIRRLKNPSAPIVSVHLPAELVIRESSRYVPEE